MFRKISICVDRFFQFVSPFRHLQTSISDLNVNYAYQESPLPEDPAPSRAAKKENRKREHGFINDIAPTGEQPVR
jgi:hypothetical protein